MKTLYRIKDEMALDDQLRVLNDVQPMFVKHQTWLAGYHADGEEFVIGIIDGIDTYGEIVAEAGEEVAEADAALGNRTRLSDDCTEHVKVTKKRVKVIARAIEKENPGGARALLQNYGIKGNRLSANRRAHLPRLLAKLARGHRLHGALVEKWGLDAASQARTDELIEELPKVTRSYVREQAEAESAIDRRDAFEDELLEDIGLAFELIEAWQEEDPAVITDFASVLNKHRDKLVPSRDVEDREEPAPVEPMV